MDPNLLQPMDEGELGETVNEANSTEDNDGEEDSSEDNDGEEDSSEDNDGEEDSSGDGDDEEDSLEDGDVNLEDILGEADDVSQPEIPDNADLKVLRIYMLAKLGKLEAILKLGSDVNLTNTDGLTAYDLAQRDEEGGAAMALLEEAGARPQPTCNSLSQQVETEPEENLTVNQIYNAANHGDPGFLRAVVLNLGCASIDAVDTENKTALMLAVYNNDVVAVSTLVHEGATVSPLILDTAMQWCNEDMVQTLLTSSDIAAKEERHKRSVDEIKELIKSSNACENNNIPRIEGSPETTEGSGNIENQEVAESSGNCGLNHLQDDCADNPSLVRQREVGETSNNAINPCDASNTDRCDGIEMPNVPSITDTNPDNTDTNPDNTDTNPDNTDTNPDNTDTNPDNTDTNPDTNPKNTDITPSRSDKTTNNLETNSLFESIANGDVVTLQYLLETHPDLNARDSNNRTLLHAALQAGQLDMVKILLTAGADCNAEDIDGNTPLMVACERGVREAVSLLVQHGAEVTFANRRGETALRTAAVRSDLAMLFYLGYLRLRFGHRTALSSIGRTALSSFRRTALSSFGRTALSSVVLISVLAALFSFVYIAI
ncbi:putative ankyrin repeat protein RF_0381 [Physella acuta]|uniref:putative ankyrin repeat protein RF_0381 n=1 Tax=Physella acuta TaxID=109671 RepID=UPI0027DD9917|nr:putative ankyrin repeat protein RF_0381 [Physella acuta]